MPIDFLPRTGPYPHCRPIIEKHFAVGVASIRLHAGIVPIEIGMFSFCVQYCSSRGAFCRIVLNTGIRPPKEVLSLRKEHVNLSDDAHYCKIENADVLIPPRAVLVARGKDGRPRVLPLNTTAYGCLFAFGGAVWGRRMAFHES